MIQGGQNFGFDWKRVTRSGSRPMSRKPARWVYLYLRALPRYTLNTLGGWASGLSEGAPHENYVCRCSGNIARDLYWFRFSPRCNGASQSGQSAESRPGEGAG